MVEHKHAQSRHQHEIELWSREKWESEPALISTIFHFHLETAKNSKPTNLHQNCEVWQLRFLGKNCNLFHNMQARYLLSLKFMSGKDTHLIPSCLTLAVWCLIMLVNRQISSYFFIAHLQSHVFVIFNSSYAVSNKTSTTYSLSTFFFHPPI